MKMNQLTKKRIAWLVVVFLVLAVTAFRLTLSWKAAYWLDMTANFDDQLFIGYAQELLNGNWLGEHYTRTTLSKGISYSLFIFLANKLNISYSLALGGFNVIASFIVGLSFRPIARSKWSFVLIYTFFLFSPIGFMNEYSTRVYRNAIVVPAVMIVIACLIGIYFRKFENALKLLPWFVILAVTFPFYWFIREDSIWLLPLTIVALTIVVFQILLQFTTKQQAESRLDSHIRISWLSKLVKLPLFILPILSFYLVNEWIEEKNEEAYGVAITNDRTGGEFGELMKNLIRMDDGTDLNETDSRVWVSHATLDKAVEVSPTLSEISSNISSLYKTSAWTGGGRDKEITGDIIFWAIRDVAHEAGYYEDNAKETNDFWHKVNQELATAYQEGDIQKKEELYLTGTGDGKLKEDLPIVYDFMKAGYSYNLFYQDFAQGERYSVGTKSGMEQAQNMLGVPLMNRWIDIENPTEPNFKLNPAAKIANVIIEGYQKTAIPLLVLACVGVLIALLGSFFSKQDAHFYRSSLLIITGLALTQFIFLLGVSWFCSWSPDRKETFMTIYTGAGVPVSQFIVVFGLICITKLSIFKKFRKKEIH